MNTFGNNLRLTTFGESHGRAIGGIIDGFAAGFRIDVAAVQRFLDRRRPGRGALVSARNEPDIVEFLSGISDDGTSLGTPIGFMIANRDSRPADYEACRTLYRPNHADYTYMAKYGIRDIRGGGRSSARETACRVVAGAIASQWLAARGVTVMAYVSGIGDAVVSAPYSPDVSDRDAIDHSPVKSPFPEAAEMQRCVERCLRDGDSVGGRVSCVVCGLPPGVGEPLYDKLQARLAYAMLSINAAKGFEYGLGFDAARSYGSQTLDLPLPGTHPLRFASNFSGGIQGGISNGMPVTFSVAFKPTPTLMRDVPTVDADHAAAVLHPKGRHDPCVAIRAVPVVEAMAALTVADMMM